MAVRLLVSSLEASLPQTFFLSLGTWMVLLAAIFFSGRVGCSSSVLSVLSCSVLMVSLVVDDLAGFFQSMFPPVLYFSPSSVLDLSEVFALADTWKLLPLVGHAVVTAYFPCAVGGSRVVRLVFLSAMVSGLGSCGCFFFWRTGLTAMSFAWLSRLKHFLMFFQILAFHATW